MVIRSQGICHKGGLDQLVRIPFTNKFNQLSKLFWIKTYMFLKYILRSVCNRPANLHICLLGTEQLQFKQERFGMPEGFCQSMPGCRTALHILTSADYSILQDPLAPVSPRIRLQTAHLAKDPTANYQNSRTYVYTKYQS